MRFEIESKMCRNSEDGIIRIIEKKIATVLRMKKNRERTIADTHLSCCWRSRKASGSGIYVHEKNHRSQRHGAN